MNLENGLSHEGHLEKMTKPCDSCKHIDLAKLEQNWDMVPISTRVPPHIKERIKLAFDLFRYSYFCYYFKDVAFLYILITYEAALKETYKVKDVTFEQLINSALNNGLIPTRYPSFKVNALRRIRNELAHGSARMPGLIKQRNILEVVDLINAVFDPEARINVPKAFIPEQIEQKKMKKSLSAISRIPAGKLKPGDSIAVSGADDYYEKGRYECLFCGSHMVLKEESPSLPVCRKCKNDLFLYHAPSIAER